MLTEALVSFVVLLQLKRTNMAEAKNLGGMIIQRARRKMRPLMEMRIKMENKGPLLSPRAPAAS